MTFELLGVAFFLGAALFLYAVLGGADFGAGVVELVAGRRRARVEEIVSHAIAPVWETNHVWLVIAVVIVFMAFPRAFALASVHLHLPLLAVLLGIVARGTAFTFRHYATDASFDRLYTALFTASSLWTPFFLGVTAGATMSGRIAPDAATFREAYVTPWLGAFPAAVGVFAVALFAMLAAVYLVGETEDDDLRRFFRGRALAATVATVIAGALVFALDDAGLRTRFLASPWSLACFASATLLWAPFWIVLRRSHRAAYSRLVGGSIAAMVFVGWYAAQFPVLLRITEGGVPRALTFAELAAPGPTLRALFGALVAGSFLILPGMGYLLWVFKRAR